MKNIALRKKCPLYHKLDNFLIYTPVVERTLLMKDLGKTLVANKILCYTKRVELLNKEII